MSTFLSHWLVPIAIGAVAVVLLAGLINMMRGGSGNTSRPSNATPLEASTSRAGSVTTRSATVTRPAAISRSAARRDATPQWARYLTSRIAQPAAPAPAIR